MADSEEGPANGNRVDRLELSEFLLDGGRGRLNELEPGYGPGFEASAMRLPLDFVTRG